MKSTKCYDPGWRKSLRKVYMKTMTSKLMALINKANDLMEVPMIRGSVMNIFDLEVEALALILIIRYALIASTTRGYHGTILVAAIILVANFALRLVAAIKDVPASIQAYKEWKNECDRFDAWNEKLREAVEEAAKAAEKNQE